jgi:hypothetical protein
MYAWRVWKNNRFAGYVVSSSQYDAYIRATEQFGQNVWVERMVVSLPNNQDHICRDSQPA